MAGFRKGGYKNAARRYYRRRNMQASRAARRRYHRKKKVSIAQVKRVATRVAKRLDKKKMFQNWQYRTLGTYTDTVTNKGVPLLALGIANRPAPYFIATGSTTDDFNFAQIHTDETPQGSNDPLQLLLHQRKSMKIYIDAIQIKGKLTLPGGMGYERIKWSLMEVKVPSHLLTNPTEYAVLINTDSMLPSGTGFIQPRPERQLKTDRVLSSRSWHVRTDGVTDSAKYFSHTVKFKKPKLVEFNAADLRGRFPLNRFFWHGFICNGRWDDAGGSASTNSPLVTCNIVVRYHEKLD